MSKRLGMSLVLTCYNRQEYIKEAIMSVFAQDYDGPMQLVIVDDASTDDSVRIIEETVKEHGEGWDVEIVKLKQNLGVAGATDAGWAKAKYDWILMVDGDDVQLPERCRIVEETATKYPTVSQISCAMKYIDEGGGEFNVCSYGRMSYEASPEELLLDTPCLNWKNVMGFLPSDIRCVGAAFHRSIWDKWGPLCSDKTKGMRFEQDPTLAFRAALSGPIVGVRKFALCWRMHSSNLSNFRLAPGVEGIMQFERYQDKYQDFHASSVVCMLRDLERATHDETLTNWPPDLLEQTKEKLERELAGCQLRSMWWSISYFERCWRVMKNWRRFRQSGTSLLRLLPFRVFCLLKYWRKRREWAKS